MNLMIALVIQYLLCVLPMVKIWHFSGKFDQHLSLYCGSVKPKFKTGLGYRFLWGESLVRFNFQNLLTILAQFLQYTFNSNSNFYPIEITWRKMTHSVCLKPVSMEMWRMHTLWRFTVPAYIAKPISRCSSAYCTSVTVLRTNEAVVHRW